jgi:hypothetical protein
MLKTLKLLLNALLRVFNTNYKQRILLNTQKNHVKYSAVYVRQIEIRVKYTENRVKHSVVRV